VLKLVSKIKQKNNIILEELKLHQKYNQN